jgi:hypothetical protein
MRKKITILMSMLFVLVTSGTFAQYNTINFETGGTGAAYNWVIAENASNPPMTFVANPSTMGANSSATVAEFTALQAGNPWALAFTDDIGTFTFDANNSIVKIMVYKPTISNVGVKFEMPGGAFHEILIPNTVTNQWEELTFDFSSKIGSTFSRLVIIPDFVARTQTNTIYLDNIRVPSGAASTMSNVTFKVDMSQYTGSTANGVFLNGTFNGWCGSCNAMTDSDGDGVWEVTLPLTNGAIEYKFTVDGWNDQEQFVGGEPCTVTNGGYTNRSYTVTQDATIPEVCWNACAACGGSSMINVTFLVDMNSETVDAAGVFLGGDFEGWTGSKPLTDADGNGVWEYTTQVNAGQFLQWKFINGAGWAVPEQFDASHSACTQDFAGYINRVATVANSDTTLPAFVFNSCVISTVNTNSIFTKTELFTIAPTLVSDAAVINFNENIIGVDKQIRVMNAVGQVVMSETVGQVEQYRLDASNFSNGLYFVVIQSEGFAQTARILVSK